MRKALLFLFLLLLPLCALAETFTVGSRGDEVKALKERLQALGYYKAGNITRQYTEDTAERVRRFQRANGLPETGEADEATQEWLYSPDARPAPHPTMRPLATPGPTPVPDWPERDGDGPADIARSAGLVLGISDDFYTYRINNKKETVGVVIRDGKLLYNKIQNMGHHLPNLDMMAQYSDGSLAVYDNGEITAEELLAAGAVNVYSFGPWLIRDGEINEVVYDNYKSLEPRHALGMIAPGHYFALSIQGRTKFSEGTTLQRAAEILKSRGVTQALNLDGGNTMALVFHGQILNEPAVYDGKKFVRRVPSLIGIGETKQ